jgi:hypothetical protein
MPIRCGISGACCILSHRWNAGGPVLALTGLAPEALLLAGLLWALFSILTGFVDFLWTRWPGDRRLFASITVRARSGEPACRCAATRAGARRTARSAGSRGA